MRIPQIFPGVAGCVDGTHVKIQAPSDNEEAWYNSINFQAICDYSSWYETLIEHQEINMIKELIMCKCN